VILLERTMVKLLGNSTMAQRVLRVMAPLLKMVQMARLVMG
jgi:hypothetical protein